MSGPTHAAMVGGEVPAPGGPDALHALLHPPKPLPHKPGRVREYTLVASDRQIEVAKGVFFNAWTSTALPRARSSARPRTTCCA